MPARPAWQCVALSADAPGGSAASAPPPAPRSTSSAASAGSPGEPGRHSGTGRGDRSAPPPARGARSAAASPSSRAGSPITASLTSPAAIRLSRTAGAAGGRECPRLETSLPGGAPLHALGSVLDRGSADMVKRALPLSAWPSARDHPPRCREARPRGPRRPFARGAGCEGGGSTGAARRIGMPCPRQGRVSR